jgi:hypothetical protein
MKITIVKQGIRKNEVYFAADCGEGKGIWGGVSLAEPGSVHEAEFELSALFMRWVDIVPVSASDCAIGLDGDQVVLTGTLENIEEDGTGYLRLGTDLIMFECLGEPMALGGWVELRTRELDIFPVIL